jgi:hypothetical protein
MISATASGIRVAFPLLRIAGFALIGEREVRAEEPDIPFFERRTCFTYLGQRNCASAAFSILPFDEWIGSPTLNAVLRGWEPTLKIRPTAFGIYARPDPGLAAPDDLFMSLGGWSSFYPASWTSADSPRQMSHPALSGYRLIAGIGVVPGPERWWAALEGMAGDENQWRWYHGPLPADLRWVWRGENEDGSIVIDCFQAPDGGQECLSAVPEPSTIVLTLTGLAAIAGARWLRRRTGGLKV